MGASMVVNLADLWVADSVLWTAEHWAGMWADQLEWRKAGKTVDWLEYTMAGQKVVSLVCSTADCWAVHSVARKVDR